MLVSRFLLDLQTANQRSLKLSSNDPLHLSTGGFDFDGGGSVAFARIVGSLGEGFVGPGSLVCDPDPDDDDDDVSETSLSNFSTASAATLHAPPRTLSSAEHAEAMRSNSPAEVPHLTAALTHKQYKNVMPLTKMVCAVNHVCGSFEKRCMSEWIRIVCDALS